METLQDIINDIKIDTSSESENDDEYLTIEECFMEYCRFGDLEEFFNCVAQGVDVTYKDKYLNNSYRITFILDMASANGHLDILTELLKINKSIINQQNADGQTPLHWAVLNNQEKVIDLLLLNEADCNLYNVFKKRPVDEALDLDFIEIATKIAAKTKENLEDYQDLENFQVQIQEQDDLTGL